MVTHDFIEFSGQIPTVEQIVHQLSARTGLEVIYNHERTDLWSAKLERSIGLYKGDGDEYITTSFGMGDSKTEYFAYSTIWILIQMGGKYRFTLPSWAGFDWESAKEIIGLQ